MPAPPPDAGPHQHDDGIARSYVLVVIVWVIQLAAIYAFQEYFS